VELRLPRFPKGFGPVAAVDSGNLLNLGLQEGEKHFGARASFGAAESADLAGVDVDADGVKGLRQFTGHPGARGGVPLPVWLGYCQGKKSGSWVFTSISLILTRTRWVKSPRE
jgi:hypothetical protein